MSVRTDVFMQCFAIIIVALTWSLNVGAAEDSAREQARMVAEVERDFAQTAHLTGIDAMSPALAEAMRTVPRHAFVNPRDRAAAYANRPLPIGHGQTISQPFIVALMTELTGVGPQRRVLEIGTGSGYQAAILAALGADVYSIEIIPQLAERAAQVLAEQGYAAVQVRVGDGNRGWPEAAPFDAIVVTAGGELPPALIEQLAPGGRLVIPLDTPQGSQDLTLFEKQSDGSVSRRSILPVRFVPLVDGD
ncbi:MAG: protein-L-isoaspartate(D-aspartate) O-methyltransferase [Gammaproteobacteria bacterium]